MDLRYIIAAVLVISIISIALATAGNPNDRANCIRYGVPAVCRDVAVIEAAAVRARKQCPRKTADHLGWAWSYDIQRGPYADPASLAADVCRFSY